MRNNSISGLSNLQKNACHLSKFYIINNLLSIYDNKTNMALKKTNNGGDHLILYETAEVTLYSKVYY